jgi:HAD superfamily hydrolase (TIGR01548 family)
VRLQDIDAVIFDVDGVLVEVSGSFRQVISLTVQHYFNHVLDVPGEERLVTAEDTGLFKLAGNFNNDWELSKGATAFCMLKLIASGNGNTTAASLRAFGPPLEEFTGEVRKRGGGLDNALELVRERLDSPGRARFDHSFDPELVQRIFMEYYAGPRLCGPLYGIEARHYHGPGMIEHEVFLLNLSLVERLQSDGVKFGILSGRTPEEADYLFVRQGLDKLLEREYILTDDGTIPGKPNPAGLAHLAGKMRFSGGIYVGDVPDDWTVVKRYNAERQDFPPMAGSLVSTGSTSEKIMSSFIEHEPVDYLAADVNYLLRAIAAARQNNT